MAMRREKKQEMNFVAVFVQSVTPVDYYDQPHAWKCAETNPATGSL